MNFIERVEESDFDYFYSNRRKACWRRRGKVQHGRDVSEIINIEEQDWQE